jgi:hypothetical protein
MRNGNISSINWVPLKKSRSSTHLTYVIFFFYKIWVLLELSGFKEYIEYVRWVEHLMFYEEKLEQSVN